MFVKFILGLLLISPVLVHCSTCTSQKFTNNNLYSSCNDLPTLTSYLHWSYNSSNSSLSLAFVAKSSGWASWAINPTATGMIGSQAIVGIKQGALVTVKTFNISSYGPITESKLVFDVWDLSGEYSSDGFIRIFAKVGGLKSSVVNQVWQVGSGVSSDGTPLKHDFQAQNLNAKGSLDLSMGGGGGSVVSTGGDSRLRRRNIHGILNAVSWGIMFPVGAIIARYLRVAESADPAWFYLHAFCQFSGYVIGVAGWGTGLKLGSESKGIEFSTHRNLGIALFCLATVQIFALLMRPRKDHKYRFYWNIYHHSLGYAILVLGILNVFKGLDILDPARKWRSAYVIVLIVLGGITLFLEAITWIIVLRRKSKQSTKP